MFDKTDLKLQLITITNPAKFDSKDPIHATYFNRSIPNQINEITYRQKSRFYQFSYTTDVILIKVKNHTNVKLVLKDLLQREN